MVLQDSLRNTAICLEFYEKQILSYIAELVQLKNINFIEIYKLSVQMLKKSI